MARFEAEESSVPVAAQEVQESDSLWAKLFSDQSSGGDSGIATDGEEHDPYGETSAGNAGYGADDPWSDAFAADTPDEWDAVEAESEAELGGENVALIRSLRLLSGVTVFDRMRMDGETRLEITLDELTEQIDADRRDAHAE